MKVKNCLSPTSVSNRRQVTEKTAFVLLCLPAVHEPVAAAVQPIFRNDHEECANAEDQPILHLTLDRPLQPFLFTLITIIFKVVIQRLKTADVGADLPTADRRPHLTPC